MFAALGRKMREREEGEGYFFEEVLEAVRSI